MTNSRFITFATLCSLTFILTGCYTSSMTSESVVTDLTPEREIQATSPNIKIAISGNQYLLDETPMDVSQLKNALGQLDRSKRIVVFPETSSTNQQMVTLFTICRELNYQNIFLVTNENSKAL